MLCWPCNETTLNLGSPRHGLDGFGTPLQRRRGDQLQLCHDGRPGDGYLQPHRAPRFGGADIACDIFDARFVPLRDQRVHVLGSGGIARRVLGQRFWLGLVGLADLLCVWRGD